MQRLKMRRLPVSYTGQLVYTKTASNQSPMVTNVLVINIL